MGKVFAIFFHRLSISVKKKKESTKVSNARKKYKAKIVLIFSFFFFKVRAKPNNGSNRQILNKGSNYYVDLFPPPSHEQGVDPNTVIKFGKEIAEGTYGKVFKVTKAHDSFLPFLAI